MTDIRDPRSYHPKAYRSIIYLFIYFILFYFIYFIYFFFFLTEILDVYFSALRLAF